LRVGGFRRAVPAFAFGILRVHLMSWAKSQRLSSVVVIAGHLYGWNPSVPIWERKGAVARKP
jgi:hypothetical protein